MNGINKKNHVTCPFSNTVVSSNKQTFLKGETSLSYEKVLNTVLNIEFFFFNELKLKKGDVVSYTTEDTYFSICLLLVSFRSGVISNPINPKNPNVLQEQLLNITQPKLLISNQELKTQYKHISFTVLKKKIESHYSNNKENLFKKINLKQNTIIIFSSGSTSFPKAVVLSTKNLYYSFLGSQEIINIQPHDTWGLTLPLFHISGVSIVSRCFFSKASITIHDHNQANIVSWVPTLLKRFLDTNKSKKFKAILIGGATCPPNIIFQALKKKLPIFYSYGMSEMSSQIYTEKFCLENNSIRTKGKILKYVSLKISNNNEILVKGKTLFEGYLNKKGEIIKKLDEEGFFNTNDLGVLENNNLNILGRKDNVFISGGENIQPELVEKNIISITNMKNVIVLGKENEEYGNIPVAFVDFIPDTKVLNQKLKQQIPSFMIPKDYYEIPKKFHNNFKIKREELKEHLKNMN